MKRCVECKSGNLKRTTAPDTIEMGGHSFTAILPALRCEECGEVYFDAAVIQQFELRAAAELARAGEHSGQAMRSMRKALGLRAADLAELLNVRPETVSRWETETDPIDRIAMGALGAMVLERVEGRSIVLEALKAQKEPRLLAPEVTLAQVGS